MIIPHFESREEKKAWWMQNHNQVEQETLQHRFEAAKEKNFKLPDKSLRLVYLRIGNQVDKKKSDKEDHILPRLLMGKPVGCLVTRLYDSNAFSIMEFQFSSHNVLDRYNKAIGRTVALERLVSMPLIVRGKLGTTPYKLKRSAMDSLVYGYPERYSDIALDNKLKLSDVPTNIRKAAKEWIKFRNSMDPGLGFHEAENSTT